jgi:hypothetical protein
MGEHRIMALHLRGKRHAMRAPPLVWLRLGSVVLARRLVLSSVLVFSSELFPVFNGEICD